MRKNGGVRPADLEFWVEATKLRLRTTADYALLDEAPAPSADGPEGVRLEFGRDEEGRTYRYDITILVTNRFVHVIETAGEEDLFDGAADAPAAATESYLIRR
jgi:hypothetical protein